MTRTGRGAARSGRGAARGTGPGQGRSGRRTARSGRGGNGDGRPGPGDVVVEAEGLSVVRGGKEVLRGVDLELRAGEILGLLGPSGGGKTTLMRAVVGVQRRVTGRLDVLGRPAGGADLRGRIGYVTQAPAVYDDITAAENLAFFAAVLGAGRDDVDRALAAVGLTGAADQVVGSMSGGQRGRVSLATALLSRPPVLVLDEPTVGLDPVLRRSLWETFRELAAGGAGLLVSSHVMDEAERCDRIALVRDGVLLATGTPAGLRERTGTATVEDAFLALVEEAAA
ncbi:heme ABC exporter ATP-binding protein CcmA [Georgenia sp. Z1491]|uniref:heme ABC exporter ATP-binding protein CcmA n=1 Tax=Georgenia sp. Z1491 TaxID=3416707 RepID=UPI003CEB7CF8